MESTNSVGLHGKIPGLGDFVTRNLPMQFTAGWDQWMQQCLVVSQQKLGSDWLNHYLTSPVWYFSMSAGVLGTTPWAGLMMPSVDKVGRYYPLVFARPCNSQSLATQVIIENQPWFQSLEQTALLALQDGVSVEPLQAQLADLPPLCEPAQAPFSQWQAGQPMALTLPCAQQNPIHGYPILLHELLTQRFPCYSLWWSAGSNQFAPAQLVSGYLPSPQCYTSLLAGNWQSHGWSEPYSQGSPLAFLGNSCDNTQNNHNE